MLPHQQQERDEGVRTRDKTDNPPPHTTPSTQAGGHPVFFPPGLFQTQSWARRSQLQVCAQSARRASPPIGERLMAGLWVPHPEFLGRRIPSAAALPPPRFPNPRGKLLSPLIAAICFLLSIANRTSGPRVCVQGRGGPHSAFPLDGGRRARDETAEEDLTQASVLRPEGPPAVRVLPVGTPHPPASSTPAGLGSEPQPECAP